MKSFQFLLKHTKFAYKYLGILVVLNSAFAILGVLFAAYTKPLINVAEESGDWNRLLFFMILLATFVLAQIIIQFFVLFLNSRLRGKVKKSYQSLIFKQLMEENELPLHSGDYISRITSDVSYMTDGITYILPRIALVLSRFIASAIAIYFISSWLILIILGFGILYVLVHIFFKRKMVPRHLRAQEREAYSRSFMQEYIEHHPVISTFGRNDGIIKENNKRLLDSYREEVKRADLSMVANLGVNIAHVGSSAIILFFSAFQIFQGVFTFGDLTSLMALYSQIQSPLESIADLNQRYILMMSSTKRIMELFHDKEEIQTTVNNFETIELRNFSFSYPEQQIFLNANFIIHKGEIVTLRGPSGVGKSTLIKILLGKLKIDSGEVLLDGKETMFSHLFAYVPQGNWLTSGTLRESLTLYHETISDEEIYDALKTVCLDDFTNLDESISERSKDISEGQAQRLAIARSLLLSRPILLLDEVTSALDEKTELQLLQHLKNRNQTILFISHKEASNQISHRIYELDKLSLKERG